MRVAQIQVEGEDVRTCVKVEDSEFNALRVIKKALVDRIHDLLPASVSKDESKRVLRGIDDVLDTEMVNYFGILVVGYISPIEEVTPC